MTAARAAARGLPATIAPLFHLRAMEWDAPTASEFDALLLTSANAARFGGEKIALFTHLPCYAVGEATAGAARSAGFEDVRTGPSDGDGALGMIARDGAKRVLLLCGREHIPLAHSGVCLIRRIVYAAEEIPELPASVLNALRRGAVALIHSPRAGAVFGKLVDQAELDRSGTSLAAISQAAATAAGPGWRSVEIALRPRDEALLEVAAKLCKIGSGDTGKVG